MIKKDKRGQWWKDYSSYELEIRMAYVAGCRWRALSPEERTAIAKQAWITRRAKLSTGKAIANKK